MDVLTEKLRAVCTPTKDTSNIHLALAEWNSINGQSLKFDELRPSARAAVIMAAQLYKTAPVDQDELLLMEMAAR